MTESKQFALVRRPVVYLIHVYSIVSEDDENQQTE